MEEKKRDGLQNTDIYASNICVAVPEFACESVYEGPFGPYTQASGISKITAASKAMPMQPQVATQIRYR